MLMPREKWKDIEGYEGLYQISNIGNVRSLNYRRTKGKTKRLKQGTDKGGYKIVCLVKEGKQKACKVHRLVALAFISNPNNYPEVNHKDENRANNCVDNLEWCDRKYNNNYGTRAEKFSKSMKGKMVGEKNPVSKKVICIELKRIFDNRAEANEYLGKDRDNSNISACCIGRTKTAYGMKWAFITITEL